MAQVPPCLVVMPYGVKRDERGGNIDFDLIYRLLLMPAIEQAGLMALRLDEDLGEGLVDAIQMDRLLQCKLALFDLTLSSPSVMYKLGVRHALRPQGTLLVAAAASPLLPSLSMQRSLRYALNSSGKPEQFDAFQRQMQQWLNDTMTGGRSDSPVFQLLPDLKAPVAAFHANLGGESATGTTQYRELRAHIDTLRQRIQQAHRLDLDDLRKAAAELLALPQPPADLLQALVEAYRRQQAWRDLVDLVGRLPAPLAAGARLQEQLALALNRLGQRRAAEGVLQALISRGEATNETHVLLGRVYRDVWNQATRDGHTAEAGRHLDQAIEAYLRAFEADWRDPFPGLNAVNLLAHLDVHDPRLAETLPVVRYALKRRMAENPRDFWDLASALELSVLDGDEGGAKYALRRMGALSRDAWMIGSVRNNLAMLDQALQRQQASPSWLAEAIDELSRLDRG